MTLDLRSSLLAAAASCAPSVSPPPSHAPEPTVPAPAPASPQPSAFHYNETPNQYVKVDGVRLYQHLPHAQLVLYPDSGHGALFQYHDAFVRQVDAFLRTSL